LEAGNGLKQANGHIQLTFDFDGAGTTWLSEVSEPDHPLYGLFESVKGNIAAACSSCTLAFGAEEGVQACGVPLLVDHDKRPVGQGYKVVAY